MSVIELPRSAADSAAGALVASPPPPPSPPLLLRTLPLCTVGSDTKAGPSTGFPHRMIGGGPSSALLAYQEHAAVLRDHLVAVEDSLDTVPPEDYPQLKKALLEVSKMISQMESLADTLAERRLSLRNELRTLQDENVHLHGALVRERRKAHGRDRRGSVTNRGGRKIPPPPILPRRDSSFIFNSMRPFMFPPSPPRYQPFSDTDSCVIDLTFEATGSSASTSRVIPSAGGSPGPSGTSRRGRGLSRGGRSASHVAGAKRTASSKRGRGSATRSRPRPSLRTLTGNDSNASSSSPAPTSPGFALLAGPPLAMSPISLSPEPRSPVGQNDINDLNNRLNNRNNKLAGKKMFSIFDSCPYLN